MEMNKEILDVIKKNLPEATAGVLKEALVDYDNVKRDYKKLGKDYKKLDETKSDLLTEKLILLKKIENYKDIENRECELISGEAKLNTDLRELEYEQHITRLNSEFSQIRLNDTKETFNKVFDSVFRNTVISKKILSSEIIDGGEILQQDYNSNSSHVVKNKDLTQPKETIEETERK